MKTKHHSGKISEAWFWADLTTNFFSQTSKSRKNIFILNVKVGVAFYLQNYEPCEGIGIHFKPPL